MTTSATNAGGVVTEDTTTQLFSNAVQTRPVETTLSSWPENEEKNALTSGNHSAPVFMWGPLVSLNYNLPNMITVGLVLLWVLVATASGTLLSSVPLLT